MLKEFFRFKNNEDEKKNLENENRDRDNFFEHNGEKRFNLEGESFSFSEILSDYEKKFIKKALRPLGHWLSTRTKEELPRTVLFPETSSRPLLYAVDPILKTIYSQMRHRVKEIIRKNKLQNGDAILVIDDFGTGNLYTKRTLEKVILE